MENEDRKAGIIRKLQDSQTMRALKDDVRKSTKFVATTTCMRCKEKIMLGEEECPECKTKYSNTALSVVNAFLIVSFGMFFLVGFIRPNLWIFSIIALVAYILVNKVKTRFISFTDKFFERLKKD